MSPKSYGPPTWGRSTVAAEPGRGAVPPGKLSAANTIRDRQMENSQRSIHVSSDRGRWVIKLNDRIAFRGGSVTQQVILHDPDCWSLLNIDSQTDHKISPGIWLVDKRTIARIDKGKNRSLSQQTKVLRAWYQTRGPREPDIENMSSSEQSETIIAEYLARSNALGASPSPRSPATRARVGKRASSRSPKKKT